MHHVESNSLSDQDRDQKKKLLFNALSDVYTHTRDTQTWQGIPRLAVPRPEVSRPGVPRLGVTRPVVPRLGVSGPGVSRPRETQTGPDWGHPDGEGDQNQRYTPPAVDTHVYEYSEQGAQTKVTRLGVPGPVARKGLPRLEDT